ncbi:MAG: hypothetical protein LBK18_00930 [Prevotellaceae bacterium]|nr:hypothetical protein [Prevotellaceae bacterium]
MLLFEVDFDKILETFSQLANGGGFAHLPGATDEQRLPAGVRFPLFQMAVNIPFKVRSQSVGLELIVTANVRIISKNPNQKYRVSIKNPNQIKITHYS